MLRLMLRLVLIFTLAIPSIGQTLLVANQGDHTISLVDPSSARQVAVINETVPGQWSHELAISPDGHTAYAPIYGNSGVGNPGLDGSKMLVIDIGSRKITDTVDFGRGVRPHCVLYEPHSDLLYVTTELAQSVTIVDPKSLKVIGSIPTGQPQSHMLAISHDGKRGYTSNVGPGTVSVLDLDARKQLAVIPVAPHTQRVSISNDDKFVFTADTTQPRLAVIDTASNKVTGWIELPSLGYGTAPTRDGRSLLVALPAADKIGVVDMGTRKMTRTIDVCRSPQEILIRPDGIAYASCPSTGQVAMVDVSQGRVVSTIDVGKGADGLAFSVGDAPKR